MLRVKDKWIVIKFSYFFILLFNVILIFLSISADVKLASCLPMFCSQTTETYTNGRMAYRRTVSLCIQSEFTEVFILYER